MLIYHLIHDLMNYFLVNWWYYIPIAEGLTGWFGNWDKCPKRRLHAGLPKDFRVWGKRETEDLLRLTGAEN